MAAEDGSLGIVTADVLLPSSKVHLHLHLHLHLQVYLPPRDDAAEFDDGGVDLAGHQDDRELVQWRKSNKVRLLLLLHLHLHLYLHLKPAPVRIPAPAGGPAAVGGAPGGGPRGGGVRRAVPVHQHRLRPGSAQLPDIYFPNFAH